MNLLNKNVKVITGTIVGILIGMIITGGIVFASSQFNASDVKYDTSTVAGALDNLYNYAKNKSDLAEQMQKPNTWTVGTEYNFGNGVYGQRFTGTYSQTANARKDIILKNSISNFGTIISEGGYFHIQNGYKVSIHYADNGNWGGGIFAKDNGEITLVVLTPANQTNQSYDVWILYTKQ